MQCARILYLWTVETDQDDFQHTIRVRKGLSKKNFFDHVITKSSLTPGNENILHSRVKVLQFLTCLETVCLSRQYLIQQYIIEIDSHRNNFVVAVHLIAEISYAMYKKLYVRKNEIGDAIDGVSMPDTSEKEMLIDAPSYFLLHLYLSDEEIEEYNVGGKQCWESEEDLYSKTG
ncbi:hypothetical protein AVEN_243105-1 [Araneus ventricosus]|uniref:Uncharacterized protein n=1 Tax=Araneus ventricosus TaxID=182803 RepID=A0A4Y2I1I5_ARAVE|nr:hypothetical protein AVEN_243105-1 [Araneus ventricosus]